MSYLIATCTSSPWLARRDAAVRGKKEGKKTQGVFFPCSAAAVLVKRACVEAGSAAVSGTLTVGLAAGWGRPRRRRLRQPAGVLCRPEIRLEYRSRDVSDPGLRPADRSRPRPQGSLTSRLPARLSLDMGTAMTVCMTSDMALSMTRDMAPAYRPAGAARWARHSHVGRLAMHSTRSHLCL